MGQETWGPKHPLTNCPQICLIKPILSNNSSKEPCASNDGSNPMNGNFVMTIRNVHQKIQLSTCLKLDDSTCNFVR